MRLAVVDEQAAERLTSKVRAQAQELLCLYEIYSPGYIAIDIAQPDREASLKEFLGTLQKEARFQLEVV